MQTAHQSHWQTTAKANTTLPNAVNHTSIKKKHAPSVVLLLEKSLRVQCIFVSMHTQPTGTAITSYHADS